MKKLNVYIDVLIKKLSTTEAKSILGVLVLVVIMGFVWYKVVQAKDEAERNRNRRRGNRPLNRPRNNANNYANRDVIRRLTAKQRYLQSRNWENQCICLCLEQLINHDISLGDNTISFKNMEIVLLLKKLAKKHRLYIIHLLPKEIILTLNNDKPSEQSKYEKDVINLFKTHGIVQSGLAKHKILFCTTQKGKSSMVRQLLPTLYMDNDEFVLKELCQHLTEVVQITPLLGAGGIAPTVFVANSVLSYFT